MTECAGITQSALLFLQPLRIFTPMEMTGNESIFRNIAINNKPAKENAGDSKSNANKKHGPISLGIR